MSEDLREYHRLLELSPTADPVLIRSAYRRRALSVHPDLNPDDPDAAAKFAQVRKAFAVLIALAEYREADQDRRKEQAPPREIQWRMVKLERDGLDLSYHLSLASGPTRIGGRLVIPHRVDKLCPQCRGRGRVGGKGLAFFFSPERICEKCSGLGLIRQVGRVEVDLPPSSGGEFSLRLKGRGALDPGTSLRGDLVLVLTPQQDRTPLKPGKEDRL